jgi:hypothetical protein
MTRPNQVKCTQKQITIGKMKRITSVMRKLMLINSGGNTMLPKNC